MRFGRLLLVAAVFASGLVAGYLMNNWRPSLQMIFGALDQGSILVAPEGNEHSTEVDGRLERFGFESRLLVDCGYQAIAKYSTPWESKGMKWCDWLKTTASKKLVSEPFPGQFDFDYPFSGDYCVPCHCDTFEDRKYLRQSDNAEAFLRAIIGFQPNCYLFVDRRYDAEDGGRSGDAHAHLRDLPSRENRKDIFVTTSQNDFLRAISTWPNLWQLIPF